MQPKDAKLQAQARNLQATGINCKCGLQAKPYSKLPPKVLSKAAGSPLDTEHIELQNFSSLKDGVLTLWLKANWEETDKHVRQKLQTVANWVLQQLPGFTKAKYYRYNDPVSGFFPC